MATPAPAHPTKLPWSARIAAVVVAVSIIAVVAHRDLARHWRNWQLGQGTYTEQTLRAAFASPNISDRESAIAAIAAGSGSLTPLEVEIACRLLRDDDPALRDQMVRALDRRATVRDDFRAAVIAYGGRGPDALAPALAGLAYAGPVGTPSLDLCLAGMAHADARTRAAANRLLGDFPANDQAVARYLAGFLRHPDPYVRQQVTIAAVRFAPLIQGHADKLAKQAMREDWFIRRHQLTLLVAIGAKAAPAVFTAWKTGTGEPRDDMARTLIMMGDQAVAIVPGLLRELDHRDIEVRTATAEILAAVDPDALDKALVPRLTSTSLETVRFAIDAYSTIPSQARARTSTLLPFLEHADPGIRLSALRTLLMVDSDNAPDYIAALKGDKDPDIVDFIRVYSSGGS